jgi:hypothetical protein
MAITDRYASAVRSSNLRHTSELDKSAEEESPASDADVIGAMGIADRRLSAGLDSKGRPTYDKHPLSVPLERLFTGDDGAAAEIVQILTGIVRGKALSMRIHLTPVQAKDMARATLGWFRHNACKTCGGHGFKIIPGTKTLGDSRCHPCNGTGKTQLEMAFRAEQRELVRWIMTRLELEAGHAGPAAMAALVPKLNL